MARRTRTDLEHAARTLGRRGGRARSRVLSDARKSAIAKQGGKARWKKAKGE